MADDIFCKIIRGEVPTQKILETENVIVIKDISPKAPVHDLVIPKKHIESLNEANHEDQIILGELLLAAVQAAEKEGIKESGYSLILNTGKNGGQLVPHVHIHILGGKNLGPKLSSLE